MALRCTLKNGSQEIWTRNDMIEAINISKVINKKIILCNISLQLNKGSISVLFGPSGCGKTTLCRNLALLDCPSSGSIKIYDNTFSFPTKVKLTNLPYPKINFVYQQLFLWPHLTNKQNILLAIDNISEEIIERLNFFSEFFNISSILSHYPNESSLGQRQRIAITRALILQPDFLFLDEITSALDIVQTRKIIELTSLLKNQGVGALIVTHNLNVIDSVADKVFFMNEGKIIEEGTKDILSAPKSNILKGFLNGKIAF